MAIPKTFFLQQTWEHNIKSSGRFNSILFFYTFYRKLPFDKEKTLCQKPLLNCFAK